MDKYIWIFIHEKVDNRIYCKIDLWLNFTNKYIWIFILQRKMTFAPHCSIRLGHVTG